MDAQTAFAPIKAKRSRPQELLASIDGMTTADLILLEDVVKVEVQDAKVSHHPLVSWKYVGCQGIVLMGNAYAGLSHDVIKNPEDVIFDLLSQLDADPAAVTAAILRSPVRNTFVHGPSYEAVCNVFGIRVVADVSYNPLVKYSGTHQMMFHRNALVVPSSRTLTLYTHLGKEIISL